MTYPDVRVIIMCKAPVAGAVKTRLLARYTAAEAAMLHAAMATTVIERAVRLFDDVVVAADDPSHRFYSQYTCPVVAQGEGNLGDRMGRLVAQACADGAGAVLLLGTDSPHMPDQRLHQAYDALANADVVVGPVEDGGYDLIAMHQPWPLFAGVAWSSGQVLVQTQAIIGQLGLTSQLLDYGFDIDFPDDLLRAEGSGWLVPESVRPLLR
ncbi:glycosyltransferase [Mariprofundus erugo]|uniref:Glycosyltransferase n=1 Tax=Mariprofundus erugo TaxID=2528639 RepID=A0A5R9GNY9_9PROT|nr:TIGR04282 family arsenosugar biosynthesis glycosyltransferase [Mariprofundus erugo]TLS66153.1 glycosyltransferase [Mariprofundus erugo]